MSIDLPTDEMNTDKLFELPDGRVLGYRCYGAVNAQPIIALHGTPGSRLKFSSTHADAIALGLHIIAPDRWHYGLSDGPAAGMGGSIGQSPVGLMAYAKDIEALANDLELKQFGVMGVSGGGPYAAAVAAYMPDRVTSVALVSPVGPIKIAPGNQASYLADRGCSRRIAGVDDSTNAGADSMSLMHKFCFNILPWQPRVVAAVFRLFRFNLGLAPNITMKIAMATAAPADRAIIRHAKTRHRLATTFIAGLSPGPGGPVLDLRLFGSPWDIPLADIKAPSCVWLGTMDKNVPAIPAKNLAEAIPQCELRLLDGEGHLWVSQNYAHVLAWMQTVRAGATPTAHSQA